MNLYLHSLAIKDTIPQQIRYETDDAEITTVKWSKIVLDEPINPKVFQLAPAGAGWSVEETPQPKPSPSKDPS